MTVHGYRLICSDAIGYEHRQFRFPLSKKRRIRKKWAKRDVNWRTVYKPTILKMGHEMICDRRTYERLMADIKSV